MIFQRLPQFGILTRINPPQSGDGFGIAHSTIVSRRITKPVPVSHACVGKKPEQSVIVRIRHNSVDFSDGLDSIRYAEHLVISNTEFVYTSVLEAGCVT